MKLKQNLKTGISLFEYCEIYFPALTTLVLGTALSLFASHLTYLQQHEGAKQKFIHAAESYKLEFQSFMELHIENLTSIRSFFRSSNYVDQKEFQTFVVPILKNTQDLGGVYYAPVIERGMLTLHIEEARQNISDYTIKNFDEISHDPETIIPVLYEKQNHKPHNLTGYNLASYVPYLEPMQKSREEKGLVFVSSHTPEIMGYHHDRSKYLTFFLFAESATGKGGTPRQKGYIVGTIDMPLFHEEVLKNADIQGLNISFDKSHQQNRSWRSLFYTNSFELAGKDWHFFYTPQDRYFVRQKWTEYAVLAGGFFISLLISGYVFLLLRQQQKDMQAQAKLNAEETRIRTIMDNVMEGIVVIDTDGIIQNFNAEAEKIFEYRVQEVIGRNVKILMPEPDRSNHDMYIRNHIETGQEKILRMRRDVTGLRKDGSKFPMHLSVTKIFVDDNPIFIGMTQDITGQKAKEQELKTEKERAEQASRAKSDFLANMSHELRTPLNSIIGLSRIMTEDAEEDSEEQDMNSIVYKSALSLLDIVNDVLDLSKIEAGEALLESIGFNFREVVSGVHETLEPVAREKGLSLNYRYVDEDLPYLKGDPVRVRRILINLIGNAVKYTEKGSIDVKIEYMPLTDGKVELSCSVIDTGIGIPEDKWDIIFHKFTQADETITRKFGGTGLGLAVTKELVEMMDGEIGLESEVGKGSIFQFKIPFETTNEIHHELTSKKTDIEEKGHASERMQAKNVRVLVAEDHDLNQAFIKKLLHRLGFSYYDVAENGAVALQSYKDNIYDLILMDCHMPEKNGYEATQAIRALEAGTNGHIPIVAMTADAMPDIHAKCLESGMDDYISKPVDTDDFRAILERWFIISDEKKTNSQKGKNKNDKETIIDFSILEDYADTPEERQEFCHIFFTRTEEGLAKLQEHCTEGANDNWVEIAHKLKGGAGMIGAIHLHSLCAQAQGMEEATARERSIMLENIRFAYEHAKTALNS